MYRCVSRLVFVSFEFESIRQYTTFEQGFETLASASSFACPEQQCDSQTAKHSECKSLHYGAPLVIPNRSEPMVNGMNIETLMQEEL